MPRVRRLVDSTTKYELQGEEASIKKVHDWLQAKKWRVSKRTGKPNVVIDDIKIALNNGVFNFHYNNIYGNYKSDTNRKLQDAIAACNVDVTYRIVDRKENILAKETL